MIYEGTFGMSRLQCGMIGRHFDDIPGPKLRFADQSQLHVFPFVSGRTRDARATKMYQQEFQDVNYYVIISNLYQRDTTPKQHKQHYKNRYIIQIPITALQNEPNTRNNTKKIYVY